MEKGRSHLFPKWKFTKKMLMKPKRSVSEANDYRNLF